MSELIKYLIEDGYLKTPEIIAAFEKIKRRDFMPEDIAAQDEVNTALPIGHGASISQPLTVAMMLEMLQPKAGEKILDIGSGSGWTTALLAEVVGSHGRVFAIERVAELKEFGQQNAAKYNFSNTEFYCRDGSKGLPDFQPFDRILVSAAAAEIPPALKDQLAVGGRLVIPTAAEDIRLLEKTGNNEFKEKIYPGFLFVPLIED